MAAASPSVGTSRDWAYVAHVCLSLTLLLFFLLAAKHSRDAPRSAAALDMEAESLTLMGLLILLFLVSAILSMGTAARQDKNIRLLFALQVIIALGFAFVDDFPSLLKPLLERLLDVWLFALYVALTFLFAGKWWLLKHRP